MELIADHCCVCSSCQKPRPKRSLASRLSGYIPPKAEQRHSPAMDETLTAQNNVKNTLPAVETLCLD